MCDVSVEEDERVLIRSFLEHDSAAAPTFALPALRLCVGRDPCLSITLPAEYPIGAGPLLRWTEGGGRSREYLDMLLSELRRLSELVLGQDQGEHLMQIVQAVVDAQDGGHDTDGVGSSQVIEEVREAQEAQRERGIVLGRRLIFFHHIINSAKRQHIKRTAIELGLGGLCKIGWPGVVVIEGEEGNVNEYVRSLSRLRWQQMVVRGEERIVCDSLQALDDLRSLPKEFQELRENGMSELAATLRAAGLEDLFKTLMK